MTQKTELQAEIQDNCPCLSVVMPAFDEEATLALIVKKVLKIPQLAHLVSSLLKEKAVCTG